VWFARFPSAAQASACEDRLSRSDSWQRKALPGLSAMTTGAPERLHLAPTATPPRPSPFNRAGGPWFWLNFVASDGFPRFAGSLPPKARLSQVG
jgi:hypothetical protein